MDYDFWLRIYGQTNKLVQVPEVMAFYRWHDKGQISANKWRQVIDAFAVRKNFILNNPQHVEHLTPDRLWDLTNGALLKEAYSAFWKRDLYTAQRLFRYAFWQRAWKWADLTHIFPSLLPGSLYRFLINAITRSKTRKIHMNAERIPVLMYHRIGDALNEWEQKYCISPDNFAAHMQALFDKGYKACTANDFFDWLMGGIQLPEKSLLITFDDGYLGVFEHGLPILRALEWPAVMFLVSDLIGKEDSWCKSENPVGTPIH